MSFIPYYLHIQKSKAADKTGISQNPKTRLLYSNTIEKGFAYRYRRCEIVYIQEFESKELARTAKRKTKKWKSINLIERVFSREITI